MYQFIIKLHVKEVSFEKAYARVCNTMAKVDSEDMSWSSTDSVFDPEGRQVPAESIQRTITRFIAAKDLVRRGKVSSLPPSTLFP